MPRYNDTTEILETILTEATLITMIKTTKTIELGMLLLKDFLTYSLELQW